MFITKKRAEREKNQALDDAKIYYEYSIEMRDNHINALQEEVDKFNNDIRELVSENGKIKRELDAAQSALADITIGIEAERTCDGCKNIGKPNTCKYCNRKAPDRYEVE